MIARTIRIAAAAAVFATPAALPAQRMSDSYEFLKAVREANGNKVTEMLDKPGQTIVNTRDNNGDGALHIAAKRGDSTYLSFLTGKGANPNLQDARGNTALLLSTEANCSECIDVLVRRKANVNLANASGETPLIRAVQLRNVLLAQKLLQAGGNPDQADVIAGMSARAYARRDTRSPALAKLLADAPKAGGAARATAGPRLN